MGGPLPRRRPRWHHLPLAPRTLPLHRSSLHRVRGRKATAVPEEFYGGGRQVRPSSWPPGRPHRLSSVKPPMAACPGSPIRCARPHTSPAVRHSPRGQTGLQPGAGHRERHHRHCPGGRPRAGSPRCRGSRGRCRPARRAGSPEGAVYRGTEDLDSRRSSRTRRRALSFRACRFTAAEADAWLRERGFGFLLFAESARAGT